MNRFNIPYSQKNIPIPSRFQYKKQLVKKVENFTRRARWKMYHILNPNLKDAKNNYGFRSLNNPPQLKELKQFEDDLFNIVSNIEFISKKNEFQKQMQDDLITIKKSENIVICADKSQNMYSMPIQQYKEKLTENVTKEYRKCKRERIDLVNTEAAKIARSLEIDDRIDSLPENKAFITIKDHKPDFPGRVECRLINPAKNHIGKISKNILDRINKDVLTKTKLNQWKCTEDVIHWFNEIENKHKKTFLKFDIVNFYPSITKKLLIDALKWAKSMTEISEEEKNIILHCRRTFLYTENDCWNKKENQDFDVSMGSLDSAEVCEIVGLFILFKLKNVLPQGNTGLYRDDGLAVLELPGPETERLRKKIIQIFKENGLKITTEAHVKSTPFLDLDLDLTTNSYKPYRKDNKIPLYINSDSNHPSHVKKELPNMISKRVSQLSSSREIFNKEAPIYNEALKIAGYKQKLTYHPKEAPKKQRTRQRNILWFNPPWNDEVRTNVGKKFLALLDKHFPKGSIFHKYFNRNNVKVSYSCMPNFGTIICGINKAKMKIKPNKDKKECNCREGTEKCMIDGKCFSKNVI